MDSERAALIWWILHPCHFISSVYIENTSTILCSESQRFYSSHSLFSFISKHCAIHNLKLKLDCCLAIILNFCLFYFTKIQWWLLWTEELMKNRLRVTTYGHYFTLSCFESKLSKRWRELGISNDSKTLIVSHLLLVRF
jgi:hypothetical protein